MPGITTLLAGVAVALSAAPSVPASAFLQAGDLPGRAKGAATRLKSAEEPLPTFCRNAYDQPKQIVTRATQRLYWNTASSSPGATPAGVVYEDVTLYRGTGAATFMTNLRSALRKCPSQRDASQITVRNFDCGPIDAGTESLLLERTRPTSGAAVQTLYWAAVRVGNTVAFVTDAGWESGSANRADAIGLAQRAAARLAAWKHP